jgi:hypothetical protein
MRTRTAAVAALLLLSCIPARALEPGDLDGTFEFVPGYRRDDINFNIASSASGATTPDVLSELTWKHLISYDFTARARVEYKHGLAGRMSLGYGWIVDGDNQDSDYGADGRALEWSRSNSKANTGRVFDFSFGMGYKIKGKNYSVTPMLLGYATSRQSLSIRHGTQTVAGCSPTGACSAPLGSINGLNSAYRTNWTGPWVGVDLEYKAGEFIYNANLEYHYRTVYKATANWNLRTDLDHPVSFSHLATGAGKVVDLGVHYLPNRDWSIGLAWIYQQWMVGPGSQTYHLAGGSVSVTQLNKVRWESVEGAISVALRH